MPELVPVTDRLLAALNKGSGPVFTPTRGAAAAAVAGARLLWPELRLVDPHRELAGRFVPLSCGHLSGVDLSQSPVVIDGTGARPWDDPVWNRWLATGPDAVVLLPARFRPAGSPTEAEPEHVDRLAALVDAAVRTDSPRDDDRPVLRRLILNARQTESSFEASRELMVRLFRLGEFDSTFGTTAHAKHALAESAAQANALLVCDDVPQDLYREAAAILDALGDCCARSDDVDAAAEHYAAGRRAAGHGEAGWGRTVSTLRHGQAQIAVGDYQAADAQIEGAAQSALAMGLSAERHASVLTRLGDLRTVRGRLQEARLAFQAAEEALGGALSKSPRRFDLRANRADCLIKRAAIAAGEDDRETASDCLDEAFVDLAACINREPAHNGWRILLAALATASGHQALSDGRLRAADVDFAHAATLYRALLTLDPDRVDLSVELARINRRLVYVSDRPHEYLSDDRRLTQAAYDRRPQDPARRHDLAQVAMAEAWLHERAQRTDGARQAWSGARDLLKSIELRQLLPAFGATLLRCENAVFRLASS
ncbi:MAG: tetratricopeptide (TPR) repeat protein [Myxococcota bacterium]